MNGYDLISESATPREGTTNMSACRIITAIGTPLDQTGRLDREGVEAHLEDQAKACVDSLLVGGTMGLMPLLRDQTWQDLVQTAVSLGRSRFELLIGAADTSTGRVLDRIAFLNRIEAIHGVVVMAPGMIKYKPDEYVKFYGDLASASRHPIYVYDLERLTGVTLSVDTICQIAEQPNIAGMKLSGNAAKAAQLRRRLAGSDFRLVVADPVICDVMFRAGFREHLDGVFAMCPRWAVALASAAEDGDWDQAAHWQAKLSQLLEECLSLPLFGAFTAIMNARGIPGRFAPEPIQMLTEEQRHSLLERTIVQELLADGPRASQLEESCAVLGTK